MPVSSAILHLFLAFLGAFWGPCLGHARGLFLRFSCVFPVFFRFIAFFLHFSRFSDIFGLVSSYFLLLLICSSLQVLSCTWFWIFWTVLLMFFQVFWDVCLLCCRWQMNVSSVTIVSQTWIHLKYFCLLIFRSLGCPSFLWKLLHCFNPSRKVLRIIISLEL